MLEVGNGGMTPAEYRSHFWLWAMMAAPLIAGNDIAHMDATTTLDPSQQRRDCGRPGRARRPGTPRVKDGTSEVWTKPLANGAVAVLLFNRGEQPATISATAQQVGWPAGVRGESARSVGAQGPPAAGPERSQATVEPHGVAMFRIGA